MCLAAMAGSLPAHETVPVLSSLSALRRNPGCKGLGHDLPISHHERVGGGFVGIVGGLSAPQDVGVLAVDGLLSHGERSARLGKFGKQSTKEGLDRVGTSEQSARYEENGVG